MLQIDTQNEDASFWDLVYKIYYLNFICFLLRDHKLSLINYSPEIKRYEEKNIYFDFTTSFIYLILVSFRA